MMQIGTDEENLPIDAAIFWTDEMHLYLRYNWESWYKVSNDDPDNCSSICKRNSAKLLLCTMTSIKHHAVRVYHIDKLPEELFGRQTDDAPNSDKVAQLDLDLEDSQPPVLNCKDDDDEAPPSLPNMPDQFSKDSDEEKEVEKQVEAFVVQTMPFDIEIQTVVDAEMEQHGGCVYSRFRPGNNRLYSFDIAQIGKRLYSIVYADFAGDWLADEDSFVGDPPLWFSESSHRVSPVHQAIRCREFFNKELAHIKIESIVVLPEKCVIINGEDMIGCWRDKCGTTVVRTKRIDETTLPTLHEYIAEHPIDDSAEVPKLDVVELVGISSRFTMNPENWIN
jgi:hypothetical protein